ncbi:MAG: electron transfer flavoprotein subunit beta/FixA family protein [Dehalococcoidia bacterium]|nr:electron transfer flavoprotein subunit beta/FixA family protein [Dehalococcoidia bacterium]
MNIVVCIKQIPDPETPTAQFKIDSATNKVVPAQGVPPKISPFDENAIETAVKLKEKSGGKVTVISMGSKQAGEALKTAVAMGCDEGVLMDDPAFADGDSSTTATVLAAAINKIGACDLVVTGRQAADWDAGQVGSGLAELLGMPAVMPVRGIEVSDATATIQRVVDDGYEVIEVPLPVVISVSNEINTPRYPTLKGIMTAARKQLIVWKAADLGLDPSSVGAAGVRSKLVKLFVPVREGKCDIMEGETVEEMAANLAKALRAAKLI